MSLNRSEKEAVISDVTGLAAKAQTLVMAEYRGITVADMTKLRSTARSNGKGKRGGRKADARAAPVLASNSRYFHHLGSIISLQHRRPYLQHAGVVVAPLRLARGIQNKILEAMAMERPVIASAECAAAVDAVKGSEVLTATSAAEFITAIDTQLANPELAIQIGHAARARVIARYSWEAHMSHIDRYLPTATADQSS